jgi:beta-lactamase class A
MNKPVKTIILVLLLVSANTICFGQKKKLDALRRELQTIIKPYKATVGIAIEDIESGDTLTINNDHQYPMQSVYKFPLAIAVLHEVDKGKMALTQKIHVAKEDLRLNTWSPLREKYPNGNIDITLASMLNYTVSKSDNNACDILFKLIKGTIAVNKFVHGLGIEKISIAATEEEMTKAWGVQYTNWTQPNAIVKLLSGFYHKKYLSAPSNKFLMKLMIESENSPMRLKGLLPEEMILAHKTGTSNTNDAGLRAAVNDAGIITLPNGKHIAIAVFVSNSTEKFENDEHIIAQISEVVFRYHTSILKYVKESK